MERIGILAVLQARPGREQDLETFLKSAQPLAELETQTVRWYARKIDSSRFAIFDTFENEAGRKAHVDGEIARQLFTVATDMLAAPPSIELVDIVACKLTA
jgi:quinol monooxygenase YgiN